MRTVVEVYDRLLVGLAIVVGIAILGSMVGVVSEVIGRYFFDHPFGWVFEFTEYVLLYTPFLGMAWLVRRAEGHVRIDVLVVMLNERSQALINTWVSLVAAVTCAITAYYAGVSTWGHYVRGVETSGVYQIPKFLLIIGISIGFAFTAVEFLRKSYRHYHQWQGINR